MKTEQIKVLLKLHQKKKEWKYAFEQQSYDAEIALKAVLTSDGSIDPHATLEGLHEAQRQLALLADIKDKCLVADQNYFTAEKDYALLISLDAPDEIK